MKQCKRCGQTKVLTDFARAAGCQDGRRGSGKVCRSELEKLAWHESHHRPSRAPEYKRRERLRRVYGITPEDFDAMLLAQDGRCGICRVPAADCTRGELAVDHDHATGQVRALLCQACNPMLGLAGDDPDRLLAAALYLLRHRVEVRQDEQIDNNAAPRS